MKKVTSLLLLAGVAAFGLVGCGDDVTTQPTPPQVQSVTVSPSSVTIEEGETVKLSANVQADDGASTAVTWASSNSSVASVDGSGNVTGQSTGTATITATSNADASKSGAAEVTVTQAGGDRPTVSILGIDCDDSIADCDDENISGDVDITVNVDEGDQDIAEVQLLLNGEVVKRQTFSTNMVSGLARATEGTSNITWELDTDGAGECTEGQQLTPNFPNGMYELSARLILEEGDDETATWGDSLNFSNSNRIVVVHMPGTGATAVGLGAPSSTGPEGQRYWGHDFMGMAAVNDTLTFAACPVVFDEGLTVSEIRVAGETDSCCDGKDDDVDLGSGHGTLQADTEEPWQYPVDPGLNDGMTEGDDLFVEDTDGGHDVGGESSSFGSPDPSFLRAFDDEGEDVTDQFFVFAVTDFWLDFVAPMEAPEGTARVQIDGMDIFDPARLYSDETADYVLPDGTVLADGDPDADGIASDYNVADVIDGGVGWLPDEVLFDVFHDTTASDGTPVATDQNGLNDGCPDGCVLDEQGPDTDPDWYYAHVDSLADILKNAMSTDGLSQLDSSLVHGLDRTEPDIGLTTDTIDDGAIIDDTELIFEATDPDLVNDADPADPGSAVNDSLCATDCAWIFATSNDTIDLTVDDNTTVKSTDPDFRIDWAGMVEGPVDLFLSVPDSAVKSPNVATMSWSFVYDTTPPTVGFSGVTGLNASDADNVTFTVEGTVTDRNGDGSAVTQALLFVLIEDPGDTNAACDTLDLQPDGAGYPIEPDTVSVLDQVQANDGDYLQEFQAENSGNAMDEVTYCFFMQADDGAITADGSDALHEQVRSASKTFTWNP